jgi:hypothetical protein
VWSYAAAANEIGLSGHFPAIEEEEAIQIETEMNLFEKECQLNGIAYRIHRESLNITLPQLRLESRFADLMIIGGEIFYKDFTQGDKIELTRDIIRNTECPVMIVPEKYEFPENSILSYDGSEESVYSIKQFIYLFPGMSKKSALLVYADENEEHDFPSRDYMIELTTQHYKKLTLHKLNIDPKTNFKEWIRNRKGSVLVCGSLGRSTLSNLFKKSFAAGVIQDHQIPVFVAHRS